MNNKLNKDIASQKIRDICTVVRIDYGRVLSEEPIHTYGLFYANG